MTLDPDCTYHTIDLEQIFSGSRTWVKLCAELLERSIHDHQPVLDRADPTCSGCAHLRRAYEDLLAQSVAMLERSARAETERARINAEFLRSVRHSHPERARQYETNPRVGRPLTSLSPELLADLVVSWAELTRAEAADATTAKLAEAKVGANAVIDDLADKIRALTAERDQLLRLRASMGLDELGLPSMIVDKLASGAMTLHEFLRQAAGAGGSRAFTVNGKQLVVSLGSAPAPSTASHLPGQPTDQAADLASATTPSTPPEQASVEATQPPTPPPAEQPSLAVQSEPPATAPEDSRTAGRPAPTAPTMEHPPPVVERAPQPEPAPPPPSAPRSPRRTVTEDALRDEAIRVIVSEEAWSERRFEREMQAIGLESAPALASLARARLVKFVHTGSDGLIFPTANFHAASANVVAPEMTSASARGWSSVLGSLTAEQDRTAFAKVLAPFVTSGWDLLFVNRAKDAQVFWLMLRRSTGDDTGDTDAANPRYRSGILGVLLSPPPYQLPEARRLKEQQVIWLAGAREHTTGLRALPTGVDVWTAEPTACADADWVAVRSPTGHLVR